MTPTLCILIGGTKQQCKDYVQKVERLGNVVVASGRDEAKDYLENGEYVIADSSKFIAPITHARSVQGEVVGVIFNGAEYYTNRFDRIIYK